MTKKRAPQPRAAKPAGPKPAAKGHRAASRSRLGAKAPKPKRVPNTVVVMELLSREGGVSVAELMKRLKIQPHTARAYISVVSRAHRPRRAVLEEGRYRLV